MGETPNTCPNVHLFKHTSFKLPSLSYTKILGHRQIESQDSSIPASCQARREYLTNTWDSGN